MATVAVVFGRDAVCFADPQVAGPGDGGAAGPTHLIDRFGFDPESHRRVEVVFTPPRPAAPGRDLAVGPPVGTVVPGASDLQPAADVLPLVAGLGPADLELVGNLPVRAQKLLTAPFDAAHPVQRCSWYYQGRADRFEVFAVVLAGTGQATLAHGSRVIPAGHDDRSSHWSLVCRRVTVLGRSRE